MMPGWGIVAITSLGGTWMRVEHRDGTLADHNFEYLVGAGGVFQQLTAAMISSAEVADGTIWWDTPDGIIDIAADALHQHAVSGVCPGSTCSGWTPAHTRLVHSAFGPFTLSLLVLHVSDLEASREFYSALGLHLVREAPGLGPVVYTTQLPNGINLELFPAGDGPTSHVRLGITVPNPEETTEAVLALGYGVRGNAVLDPDGNSIHIRGV